MKFLKWFFNTPKVEEKLLDPKDCLHLEWAPESRENGWRGYCRSCGLKASGSCQPH